MNKGQAAIMDALFFMIICSISATLLFYVSSIYGQSINQEISALYNYEYTGGALLSLMNVDNQDFWLGLENKLDQGVVRSSDVRDYIEGYKVDGEPLWPEVLNSSPSNYTFLCMKGGRCADFSGTSLGELCYPKNYSYPVDLSSCPSSATTTGGKCVFKENGFESGGFTSYTHSTSIFEGCRVRIKVYY